MISAKTNPVQWHRIRKRAKAVEKQWKLLTEEFHPLQLNQEQLKEVLRKKTRDFRARLAEHDGTAEDDLLPEAFAVVCVAIESLMTFEETDAKTGERQQKGIRLNERQIMGGVALHDGRIVEMKTGEGKTLTAALPLYLNALSGKGCILVTTNEYLARRDADELRPLYEMLGLKESCGIPKEGSSFTPAQKKEIYRADIVYTTQKALTGDYLQENRRSASEGRFLREMNYCIVDEADAVLLDNASIPHIISGSPRAASCADYIKKANDLVFQMKASAQEDGDGDYEVDGEAVWLTEKGIRRTEEEFFPIGDSGTSEQDEKAADRACGKSCDRNLYAPGNEEIVKAVTLALRAHTTLERDKRYIVRDNRVVLLDVREGRPLPDNMLQSGQHQALEAKEHVPISPQMRSLASITFQSYFNMYPRLAGMTGTGVYDEKEFRSIYGLEVVEIPTASTVARVDEPIQVYPRHDEMIRAAMEDIIATHHTGQPVLVVVSSIPISEEIDAMLWQARVPHSVLNAKNLAREAKIIQEAAKKGAVTVATAVAGRGTDIRLGGTDNGAKRKRPGKDDIENLRQHISNLDQQVTEVHHKRNLLMKDPETMTEKLQDLQRLSRQIDEDVENLEEADVRKLGGLAVIGVGMMRNKRSELQARGRSGRKGDKGRSVFYVSLEDDVVAENSPDRLKRYADRLKERQEPGSEENHEKLPGVRAPRPRLEGWLLCRAVEGTQKAAEAQERELRRQMRSVEDSICQQREIIYDLRNHVLEDEGPEDIDSQVQFCLTLADRVIAQYLKDYDRTIRKEDLEKLRGDLKKFAGENFSSFPIPEGVKNAEKKEITVCLHEQAEAAIKARFEEIRISRENALRHSPAGQPGDGELTKEQIEKDVHRFLAEYLRTMQLKAIDEAWVEQVDYLQQLREIVSGRRSAGRDMQREFQREAHKAYDLMAAEIERAALHYILFGSAA